ncbi:hypothetical protein SOO38_13245 [Staphylococcus aureus]|nr:hypothetical protein [Staphylococcus aureus]
MDIGICKLNIQEDVFFKERFSDQEKEILTQNQEFDLIPEEIEWENITISDFIDFIDFSDYEKFFIISNNYSNRFLNIINYVKDKTGVDIILYNTLHPKSIFKKIKFKDNLNIANLYNNSNLSMNTGFYPQFDSLHIKHIITDNLNSIKGLDISVHENLGFNSLIIVEDNKNELGDRNIQLFSKVLLIDDYKSKVRDMNFKKITISELKSKILYFIQTGNIKFHKGIYTDIGRYLKNKQLSTLFIYNNNIYYDKYKNILLSENTNTNVYQLINSLNQHQTINDIDDDVIRIFFLMHTLVEAHKEDLSFVTHFSYYNLPPVNTSQKSNDYSNWIGFNHKSKCYMYNIFNNKTFEVNEKFLELFEQIVKKNVRSDAEIELIKEVEELLSNV